MNNTYAAALVTMVHSSATFWKSICRKVSVAAYGELESNKAHLAIVTVTNATDQEFELIIVISRFGCHCGKCL